MIKIIIPIILFITVVYVLSHYWGKSNIKNKRKIASILGAILLILLAITTYLVIN